MLDQLELFEDPAAVAEREAEEAARRDAERRRQPHTCPICGATEINQYIFELTHGIDRDGRLYGYPVGEHPIYGTMCAAQGLVRNHISFAVANGLTDLLEERARRGRELGLNVDAIIADARARLEVNR